MNKIQKSDPAANCNPPSQIANKDSIDLMHEFSHVFKKHQSIELLTEGCTLPATASEVLFKFYLFLSKPIHVLSFSQLVHSGYFDDNCTVNPTASSHRGDNPIDINVAAINPKLARQNCHVRRCHGLPRQFCRSRCRGTVAV